MFEWIRTGGAEGDLPFYDTKDREIAVLRLYPLQV
jgi:hypothetical protein